MDALTARFYDRYAADLSDALENRRSAMLPVVERTVPRASRVLDVGAGSGRDTAGMLAFGLEAYGIEPNAAMRAKACERFPALQGRLREGLLPDLGHPFADLCPEGFDAVVCSAVLMHVDAVQLPQALAALASQLRPGAGTAMLLSLPEMNAAMLIADRDGDGRRFHNHAPAEAEQHLAPLGFALQHAFVNDTVRISAGTRWHLLTFRR